MKHSIETTKDGVRISASVSGGKQKELLDEFAKCAAGSCSCPTPQYAKVQSIDVKPQPEGVTVDLQLRPGESIDVLDLERCLEHTATQIGA